MIFKKPKIKEVTSHDSFKISDTLPWMKERNRYALKFLDSFHKTMQRKYDYQVFMDLNSDSGYQKIGKDTIESLPMKVLEKNYFSKHIFVVDDLEDSNALNVRIKKRFPKSNSIIFNDNMNSVIDKIVPYIPESNIKHKVSCVGLLTLKYPDLEFDTIRLFYDMGINLIILFSLPWTDPEHYNFCIEEERELLNNFLPVKWSDFKPSAPITSNESFFRVIVKSFHNGMRDLGYKSNGSFHRIFNSDDSNLMFMGSYFSQTGAKKIQNTFTEKITTQVSLFG